MNAKGLNFKKNWLKFTVGIVVCLLVRLIPFRVPNIEPILATQMPFSKAYGPYAGFLFAFLSILLYDLITSTLGVWTFVTIGAYGFLGLSAGVYFKNREAGAWDYVRFAVMGTLFFDIVTGFSVGPLFFDQPLYAAAVGQIPFTILHLIGNVSFAFVLSPAIYNLITKTRKRKANSIISTLHPKTI